MAYKTLQDTIGNTPLVQLTRLPGADAAARNNIILGKLEGNNPAGSVKDRAALSMLMRAEERGDAVVGEVGGDERVAQRGGDVEVERHDASLADVRATMARCSSDHPT